MAHIFVPWSLWSSHVFRQHKKDETCTCESAMFMVRYPAWPPKSGCWEVGLQFITEKASKIITGILFTNKVNQVTYANTPYIWLMIIDSFPKEFSFTLFSVLKYCVFLGEKWLIIWAPDVGSQKCIQVVRHTSKNFLKDHQTQLKISTFSTLITDSLE